MARSTVLEGLPFWPNAVKSSAILGKLAAGKAVVTTSGRLLAKHVIHTVGPIYRASEHGEAEQLASCHKESIALADDTVSDRWLFPPFPRALMGFR